MTDRDKVIDGLERLRFFNQRAGRELWQDKPHDVQEVDIANADAVYADALALLKEQEAVEPKHNPLSPSEWFCGKCWMCISRFHDYCPSCGRKVKWK